MNTIWKYELDIADSVTIDMKKDAKILHVDVQYGVPCIWALVDDSEETEQRSFHVYGTGHAFRGAAFHEQVHIGTVMLHGGSLVFHVFEVSL